jgi:hypothetical protein
MPIPLSGIAAGPALSSVSAPRFNQALKAVPKSIPPVKPQVVVAHSGVAKATASHSVAAPAAQLFSQVQGAQQRIDKILKLAQSGKTFTPAELLALQGEVYQASQQIDLASRVADKGSGGVKQVLQTQV